mmetsp:Transcript_80624/g.94058  ORF Transcript_80624/g.94058 Transcript_80624/m.94058 type:complete len:105 (-) Transcript_80624:231-545(-)
MGNGASNETQFSSSVYENSSTFKPSRPHSRSEDLTEEFSRKYVQQKPTESIPKDFDAIPKNYEAMPKKLPPAIAALRNEAKKGQRQRSASFDQYFEMHSLQMFT